MKRLVFIVAIVTQISGWAGIAWPQETFGLTGEVRITWIGYYLDGGTVGFEVADGSGTTLSGCFDGRMKVLDSASMVVDNPPRHCHVGARHPDEPGARALPLWGEEERSLMDLLGRALADTLSQADRELLHGVRAAVDLPEGISVEMWHFAGVVDFRRQVLDGIDAGLLTSASSALRYFEMTEPVILLAVETPAPDTVIARVQDSSGKLATLGFPIGSEEMGPSTSVGDRYSLKYSWGSQEDRMSATLAMIAAARPSTEVDETALELLRTTLQTRRRLILERDREADASN